MTDRSTSGPTHRDGPMAFVDDVAAPELDPDDRHHLARVLRVRDGENMVVCDGRGSWAPARFGPEIAVTGPARIVDAPSPVVTVAFSLVKGDRPELVVQKLTELGVDRIVPFVSDHGVVRWNEERAAKQLVRFRRIAREASMQCRRTHLPTVEPLTDFAALVDAVPAPLRCDVDGRLLGEYLGDRADGIGPAAVPAAPIVLIGPEGGWSEAERSADLEVVGLGEHVLRAETAAIAAAVLLTSWRSAGGGRSDGNDNGG